jgi:hypothetical protein
MYKLKKALADLNISEFEFNNVVLPLLKEEFKDISYDIIYAYNDTAMSPEEISKASEIEANKFIEKKSFLI